MQKILGLFLNLLSPMLPESSMFVDVCVSRPTLITNIFKDTPEAEDISV